MIIPEREPRPDPMWQCQVTTKDGKQLPVGPASNVKNGMPAMIAEAINKRVAKGIERDWRDATVVEIARIIN